MSSHREVFYEREDLLNMLDEKEAEAQTLSEQNTKFQHMLADVVAKHFAENIKRSTAQKSMDVYLSEGIRLLEEERDRIGRNRDMWKGQCERQAEQIAALRARVVVVPDRYVLDEDDTKSIYYRGRGFNACLDELARLNGKAVSEGLLRSSREAIAEYADGIRSLVRRIPGTDQRLAELDQYIVELGALLGEGKEHE